MTIIADSQGVARGKFTIPAGIPSGTKSVVLVGAGGQSGSATFSGQGTLERKTFQQQTTVTETRWTSPPAAAQWEGGAQGGSDPLAQTFTLSANAQLQAIDLWFATLPTTKTRVQVRGTLAGFPSGAVLTEAVIDPSAIAAIGSPTRINFPWPILLLGGTEYAFVVLCNDAVGALSVAELGKFDATAQRWITSQAYNVGVLLSSSNQSTWTAHQDRDLAFQLITSSYTATMRTVALGNVAVTNATDLLLMSYADLPASVTSVSYVLGLPGGEQITVADGQPVQLAAAITGNVSVTAKLTGSADMSPVLFPGAQLVAGTIAASGTYVSTAFPAGIGSTVKIIYEALVPSGSTVVAAYKGSDIGDTWSADVPVTATRAVGDGWTEFTHSISAVNETAIQIRLTLNGTAAARPRIRDLRGVTL